LVFSFPGLVVGSVLYSLPFVVQPLHNAFRAVPTRLLDAAATLLARITRKSLIQLGLKPGREIFARVKSVAVLD